MRGMEMVFELFVETMAVNLKTLIPKPFIMIWVSNISFILVGVLDRQPTTGSTRSR
jgi:hypothetical protein